MPHGSARQRLRLLPQIGGALVGLLLRAFTGDAGRGFLVLLARRRLESLAGLILSLLLNAFARLPLSLLLGSLASLLLGLLLGGALAGLPLRLLL